MKANFHRPALALTLAGTLALPGCMSMSGLGGDSKYACKAPEGVACDSVSGTYANAVANNLPSQRKRQAAAASPTKDDAAPRRAIVAGTKGVAATTANAAGAPSESADDSGLPLRSQARYLRLWIKPWEDVDGDLYDQAHVYVQIDQGRWQIDHLQQRIRDASAPLRPPVNAAGSGTGISAGTTSPSISADTGGAPTARSVGSLLAPRQALSLPGRGLNGSGSATVNSEVTP